MTGMLKSLFNNHVSSHQFLKGVCTRKSLKQFLRLYRLKILKIIWHGISQINKFAFMISSFGKSHHIGRYRMYFGYEICIWMLFKQRTCFITAIAKEYYRPAIELLTITVLIQYQRTRRQHILQCEIMNSGVHFHTPGINHRREQHILIKEISSERVSAREGVKARVLPVTGGRGLVPVTGDVASLVPALGLMAAVSAAATVWVRRRR